MTAYATVEELTDHLGSTPTNAAQLLVRASRDVDRALLASVYDDTDTAVTDALRDATLEQVAGTLAGGDTGGLGSTNTPSSFTIGRLAVQGAAATTVPRTGQLVDQAYAILQAAGLTGHAPQGW
jgi:hypothetical protein